MGKILFIYCFITISTLFAEQSLKEIFQEKDNIKKQKELFCQTEGRKIGNIVDFLKSDFDFYSYSKEKLEEKWKQKAELAVKLKQMILLLDINNEFGEACVFNDDKMIKLNGFIYVKFNSDGNCDWSRFEKELLIGVMHRHNSGCIVYPDEEEIGDIMKDAYQNALSQADIQKQQQSKQAQNSNTKDNKKQNKCLDSCKPKKGAAHDICINDCKRIYGGVK